MPGSSDDLIGAVSGKARYDKADPYTVVRQVPRKQIKHKSGVGERGEVAEKK